MAMTANVPFGVSPYTLTPGEAGGPRRYETGPKKNKIAEAYQASI